MTARTLVTRKGEKFETTLTDEQAFDVLRRDVETNGDKVPKFPRDLVAQAAYRGLSREQWIWVHKLAMERVAPKPAPAPLSPVGQLGPIVAMMTTAAKTLRHPRVAFREVQLSIAGPRSKEPGTINVTSEGRWGERVWYGRITTGGAFHPARLCPESVATVLRDLASDPAGMVAAEGRKTGSCCFCRRVLSTDESLAVGYGPICADKFGLPWGDATPSAAAIAADSGEEAPEEDEAPPPTEKWSISYGSVKVGQFEF